MCFGYSRPVLVEARPHRLSHPVAARTVRVTEHRPAYRSRVAVPVKEVHTTRRTTRTVHVPARERVRVRHVY